MREAALLGALVLHPHTRVVTHLHNDPWRSVNPFMAEVDVRIGGHERRFGYAGACLPHVLSSLIPMIDKELIYVSHDDAGGTLYKDQVFERASKMICHSQCQRIQTWSVGAIRTHFARVEIAVDGVCFVQEQTSLVGSMQSALQSAWEKVGWIGE